MCNRNCVSPALVRKSVNDDQARIAIVCVEVSGRQTWESFSTCPPVLNLSPATATRRFMTPSVFGADAHTPSPCAIDENDRPYHATGSMKG